MTTLVLEHPDSQVHAREYAARVVLEDWLGQVVTLQPARRSGWRLRDTGHAAQLVMPDCFFSRVPDAWRAPKSLPPEPLSRWSPRNAFPEVLLVEPEVPVIAGSPRLSATGWRLEKTSCGLEGNLCLDIFGSAFFLLSRYEEVAAPVADHRERFPASASLAQRAGYLQRPLLDEYVEILWAAMLRLWPGLTRRTMHGRVRYSCDVDAPYEPGIKSRRLFIRSLVGDFVKRGSLSVAKSRVATVRSGRRGDFSKDRKNSFDRIMDLCESQGLRGAFFFIAGHSAGAIDGCYSLNEPFISDLLERIHARGHSIGMHGSYNSFRDEGVLVDERATLVRTCESLGIIGAGTGNRQHYLRWDSAVTPALLEKAGFKYDTTGSFADRPGFRYGTARSFAMWDWKEERTLALRQRPLIVMECSVIAQRYMGLGYSPEALELMLTVKERALRFGGDFNLLWHNSHLDNAEDWCFLRQLLA